MGYLHYLRFGLYCLLASGQVFKLVSKSNTVFLMLYQIFILRNFIIFSRSERLVPFVCFLSQNSLVGLGFEPWVASQSKMPLKERIYRATPNSLYIVYSSVLTRLRFLHNSDRLGRILRAIGCRSKNFCNFIRIGARILDLLTAVFRRVLFRRRSRRRFLSLERRGRRHRRL